MTSASAKPFSFDEFGASPPTPAPSFTAEEIFEAEKNARENALDAIIAQQARAQTDLLEAISAQIENAREHYEQALSERQQSLREISEAIVINFCEGVTTHRQTELALALLDKYLSASPTQSPLKLRLPAEMSENALSALKDAVSDRGLSEFVEIIASRGVENRRLPN